MDYILACFLLFTAVVRSTPVPTTSSRSCKDYSIPLNVSSVNLQWAIGPIETNEDMAGFNAEWGRRDSNSTFHPALLPSNSTPETAVYTISGTYCEPTSGGNGTVILATHGAGYGKKYVYTLYTDGQTLINLTGTAIGILIFNQRIIVMSTMLLRKATPFSTTTD